MSCWISGQQWPVAWHLPTSPEKNIVGLPSPLTPRCWEQRPCLNRELGSPTQSGWRGLGIWRISLVPPPAPGGKASGAADGCTRLSCLGGMPKATSPNCDESGAVDHLDKEAVRDCVKRLRDVHCYDYCPARGLMLVEASKWEQGWGGRVPRFEAVMGGACTQCLHNRREEDPLQYLHCRAEQWDGALGAILVSCLPCFQNWDYDGVPPNFWDVVSGNWKVEALHQEGQAVLTQMAEVEHCEPASPLGSGRARLPYGRCDGSLVERPIWGVHTVVAVKVDHEPSECPIVLGGTSRELLVEGLCNHLRPRVGFSLKGDWDVWWGTRSFAA